MTQDFDRVISQLAVDAEGVDFTGFVTNARIDSSPTMVGEVWKHVRADPSGRFADGHRIHTSRVMAVHLSGESAWVVTETGSRYGIISFAPSGWRWFSNFIRRSVYHVESPVFIDLRGVRSSTKARQREVSKELGQDSRKRHPLRPPPGDKHLEQYKAHFTKTIGEMKSNGVVVSHRTLHDEAAGKDEPDGSD